jgi:hypothetical protein
MALQDVKVSCETVNWRKVTNEGDREGWRRVTGNPLWTVQPQKMRTDQL